METGYKSVRPEDRSKECNWETCHMSRRFRYRSHECETDRRQVKRVGDLDTGHMSVRLGDRSKECETGSVFIQNTI